MDPEEPGKWRPLPTRDDLNAGTVTPVTFENGTQHEIHGKLFEKIVNPQNTTYLDDMGVPNATVHISFDGEPVPGVEPGNVETRIEPFKEYPNGTFQFILDINRPTGEYELKLEFAGDPAPPAIPVWKSLTYIAIVYVSHPAVVRMDVSPSTQVVGRDISVSGSISDDMYDVIPNVPLQLWFDNELLGPTSDGVYLDDVKVQGAEFQDDFEEEGMGDWSTYTAPARGVGDQWEHGSPGTGYGPRAPHSGSQLWGTVLNGNYQRGAWSFLVTPRLNFTGTRTYTLSFWAWWSVYWNEDYAYVLASMDGGATWDEAGAMRFMGTNLASGDWTLLEYNVTKYVGSDNVKFAFVFYSLDKTLDVRPDGTFELRWSIPPDTEADLHRVKAVFVGNLLFREGFVFKDIVVKRIAHLEFEVDDGLKVGHRNECMILNARLVDNMGQVLRTSIRGIPYIYKVRMYWDGKIPIAEPDFSDYMDRDTGNVSIPYVVAWNQTLGSHIVIFNFSGADFYTPAQQEDTVYIKANVYVKILNEEPFHCHRMQPFVINYSLRIVPGQSILDQVIGDPTSGEWVDVLWGTEHIGSRRTPFDGTFGIEIIIPATHPLGDVLVTFEYKGQRLYEACRVYANCTIVSDTFITLEDQSVYKGTWAWINGSIMDDQGQPIANESLYIIWKRLPEIGLATSTSNGTFALQYYIEFEDKVGKVKVIARFKGTKTNLANESLATFTVRAATRMKHLSIIGPPPDGGKTRFDEQLLVDWGGLYGEETVMDKEVDLLINGILVGTDRTSSDGRVTFVVMMDPRRFGYGETTIEFVFKGSEFLDGSTDTIKYMIESDSDVKFTEIRINGKEFATLGGVVRQNDTFDGHILVLDEDRRPLPSVNISVYYRHDGIADLRMRVATGATDGSGYFEFKHAFRDSSGGLLTFFADYEGYVNGTNMKWMDRAITCGDNKRNFTYIVPPPPSAKPIFDVIGDRQVRVGDRLRLEIDVIYGWFPNGPTYALVSPPQGMAISSSGVIGWTPGEDQVGNHTITVWLYNGMKSETSTFNVTVTERDGGSGWGSGMGDAVVIASLIAFLTAIAVLAGSRRRRRPRG